MNFNFSVTTDYWLVFKQSEGYWLQKFLKKGFGHVFVITKDDYNWIVIDPHKLKLMTVIAPYQTSENFPRLLVNDGYKVLKVTTYDRKTSNKLCYWQFNFCVPIVKYILGIKVKSWTPYGLYKKMLRLNEKQKHSTGIKTIQLIQ